MTWLPLLLVLSAEARGPTQPAPRVTLESAWIALGVGRGEASDGEVRAKLGTDVRLWLVVEARVGRERRVFSRAPALKKGGRKLQAEPWPRELGEPTVVWSKLEADSHDGVYDNTGEMEPSWHPERKDHPARWHWCPIDYVETETTWGSVWQHAADARPTLSADKYGGLGTMRFVAKVTWRGQTVVSRGREHRDKTGLLAGIATVRFRRDDTPVGYMTELMNVPYVYGSSTATGSDRDHQAERGVGADCADLVVYGWRRFGKTTAYTWTGGLKGLTKRQALVTELAADKYRTGDGRPIRFGKDVQPGDLLLWGRHVAVIAARDPSGYLTPETPIVHTVMATPALVPLRQIGFGFDTPPFDLRRPRWAKAEPEK